MNKLLGYQQACIDETLDNHELFFDITPFDAILYLTDNELNTVGYIYGYFNRNSRGEIDLIINTIPNFRVKNLSIPISPAYQTASDNPYAMLVAQKYRQTGLASLLLKKFINRIKEQLKLESLNVIVQSSTQSMGFYQKHGFNTVEATGHKNAGRILRLAS